MISSLVGNLIKIHSLLYDFSIFQEIVLCKLLLKIKLTDTSKQTKICLHITKIYYILCNSIFKKI